MWLSTSPGTSAIPRPSTSSVAGAGVLAHLGVVADRDDDPVAHGDGGRVRARRVERADRRAEDREVGRAISARRQTSPSAVSTPSRIDLPQCGQVAVAAQSR